VRLVTLFLRGRVAISRSRPESRVRGLHRHAQRGANVFPSGAVEFARPRDVLGGDALHDLAELQREHC